MKRPRAPAAMALSVVVECTHCGVGMSEYSATTSGVRYFRCPSCRRCFSSMYAEIFRADAKVRVVDGKPAAFQDQDFAAVKKRLEQWLAQLDSQDPYRVLGLAPQHSLESIKSRYRELALERHPDRGGSAERMKELNLAYGRIANRKDQPGRNSEGQPERGPRPLRKR